LLRGVDEEVVTLAGNPTAEAIAALIAERARAEGLPVTEVRLWETPRACAIFQVERAK
jgi:hypothetical protein